MLISCCGCGRIHFRRVGHAAAEAFRALYTNPVRVNGALLTAADMVARARALQLVFDDPERRLWTCWTARHGRGVESIRHDRSQV